MSLTQTLQVFESLDSAHATGQSVIELLSPYSAVTVTVTKITGN